MSELSLEALGYTADEARVARRAHDLTTPPEQRAASLQTVLAHTPGGGWQSFEPEADALRPALGPHVEKAA